MNRQRQCEGCTFFNGQVRELSYLHARDVTYATFCQGPYEESAAYRDFMGWDVPWYSAKDSAEALLAPAYGLLDMTVCGRQETWEDSPSGWPRALGTSGEQFRTNGRPTAQWSRLAVGRSDDLGDG